MIPFHSQPEHAGRKTAMKLLAFFKACALPLAFGAAIAILLAAGLLSYRSVIVTSDNNQRGNHTQLIIDNIQQMLNAAGRLDADARTHLLTGDASHLALEGDNAKGVLQRFELIRDLTKDNDQQQLRLVSLQRAFHEKVAVHKAVEVIRQAGGTAAAADEIRRGHADTANLAFETIANEIRGEEIALAAARNEKAEQSVANSEKIILGGIVIIVLITGVAGWTLRGDVARRTLAERAFQDSEEKYRRLVQGIRDYAIFMMSPTGEIRTWNSGAEQMTGCPSSDAVGTNYARFFPIDGVREGRPAEIVRRTAADGEYQEEGIRIRNDGTRFLVHSTFTAFHDAKGDVAGVSVISHDLTKSAESDAKYRGLMEAAPDAMVVVNAAGEIVLLNVQAEKQFGYRRDELVGQQVTAIIPKGFAERLIADDLRSTEDALAQQIGTGIELTGSRKDGSEFPIELMLSPLESVSGILVTAAIRNISARKAAERHLVAMEARYRSLLDAAPDAMVVVNDAGDIVLLNVQAEVQFGYRRDELIGQNVTNIIPAGFEERRFADGLSTSQGSMTQTGIEPELYGRRHDGSDFPIELMLGRLETVDGALITTVIRDITRRKKAETQLLQNVKELNRSNEELGQFAYIASHDLQEPLRMVASYTQLLQRRYTGKLDADADDFIAYAVDGATRMQRLIQDLLTFSRIETKGRALCEIESELAFEQAVINLRGAIEESRAVITHAPLPLVMADESQLVQLFQNLIGNAIKYRGVNTPSIHVSAAMSGAEKWNFSIRDNGLGIDSQYFEKIFGMFQRLHRREAFAGTGIGLAVCKKIVERHGGEISVESQPGQGSTFHFALTGAIGDAEHVGPKALMSA